MDKHDKQWYIENQYCWITWGVVIYVVGAILVVILGLTLHYIGAYNG